VIRYVGDAGSFVLGWTAMFALALPTLVGALRVASELYVRFDA
jgi:hypothetical protein